MPPTAVTIFNKETMVSFARAGLTKKLDPKIVTAIVFAATAALTVFSLIFSLLFGHSEYRLFIFVLGIAIALTFIVKYFVMPSTYYEGQGNLKDIKETYTLLPDRMTVYAIKPGFTGQDTIGYNMLYMVKETSDYFFVYRNKMGAYIIDKAHLYYCDADMVRRLLLSGGAKYVACKY